MRNKQKRTWPVMANEWPRPARDYAFKGYMIRQNRMNQPGEQVWVEKDGFNIGYMPSVYEAERIIQSVLT